MRVGRRGSTDSRDMKHHTVLPRSADKCTVIYNIITAIDKSAIRLGGLSEFNTIPLNKSTV